MNWFRQLLDRFWHAPRRALDRKILWPTCCAMTADHVHAKEVFAMHAIMDPAWLALGSADLIIEEIERLPYVRATA